MIGIFEIKIEDVEYAGQWDGNRVNALDFSDHLAIAFENPEQCRALANRMSDFADSLLEHFGENNSLRRKSNSSP